MVSVAALLLVPIASASAFSGEVTFEGNGSGWVKGAEFYGGEPLIGCHWNGTEIDIGVPGPGECKTTLETEEGITGLKLMHEADLGSEFAGWKIEEGQNLGTCEEELPSAGECAGISFGTNVVIKAAFTKIPLPKFTLTTSTSGTSGSVECKIDGGVKGPCPEGVEEVEETSAVEMFAEPGAGSALNEWTSGPCENESTNPCSFTMEEDTSANADFAVASEDLTVNNVGIEGTVECQVNGGGFAPCSGLTTYSYGDEIDVTASAASEHKLASLVGTGSASGVACEVASETAGSCSFTITADSSVTATFEPAGTKDEAEGNVHGEVPITTSLESACSDVDLGEFLPGVNANYIGSCGVTLTSTGVETELRASDESAVDTGHLIQDYTDKNSVEHHYALLDALQTKVGAGTYESLDPGPVSLVTYGTPVSNKNETVWFRQHIGATEGLHTGVYAKMITLTLEQTIP
jgi:hypothetical protein